MRKTGSFLFILLFSISSFPQSATVVEDMKQMPTYAFGDPDPVPQPGKNYPYFRFDGYSNDSISQPWKMICMENDWIKLWLAPDIGGKIYGAQEKSSGNYFIYYNNVVKFRDIAMRGPWTSGGIEMNFGSIGHAPTTSTPVDYYIRENKDGSVSCFLGAIDLSSRTEWRVEVMLPPDKAWFETKSVWINPHSLGTSLYHWMNASTDVSDDLHYYFPGTKQIDHSGNSFSWPLDSYGRDISLYRNNNFGADHSYHVIGKYSDWFATYFMDKDFGSGHWNRYPLKPGKKIWMWAQSRQGAIWTGLLTDTIRGNTQYTEIQTGLLYNQAASGSSYSPFKHIEFEPGAVQNFSERWFPLMNTSGLTHVAPEIAMNIKDDEFGQRLIIYSLASLNDTIDIIYSEGNTSSHHLILGPTDTVSFSIDENRDLQGFYLRNTRLEISAKDDDRILERPVKSDEFDWNSVYGLYSQGLEYLRQREYKLAADWFGRCLEKDRFFLPAKIKLCEQKIRQLDYVSAERLIKEVLAFNAYDPDANMLYGIILERTGRLYQAKDAYGVAMRYEKYRNAGLDRLVSLSLKQNNINEARDYIKHALDQGRNSKQLMKLQLVTARITARDSLFKEIYNDLIHNDPLNHFARFENYLLNSNDSSRQEFTAGITNEFQHETYLEIATWYLGSGMNEEALALLTLSPESTIVNYYLAYVFEKLGEPDLSSELLEKALLSDIDFVFPFRYETEEILRWADDKKPDWKTKYYLSLIYWNAGQVDEASELIMTAGNIPDNYSFYHARGDLFLPFNDIQSEKDYKEALTREPDEWRTHHKLVSFYLSHGFYSRALELSYDAYEQFKGNYVIDFDHAKALLLKDSVIASLDVLKNTIILPFEGARQGREVWRDANIIAAIETYWKGDIEAAYEYISDAYIWPENLGVGRPYEVDERLLDFIKALIITKMADTEEAKELYMKIISETSSRYKDIGSETILKVFALREINKDKESDKFFQDWIGNTDDERLKNWALALYGGEYKEAEEFAQADAEVHETDPWESVVIRDDISIISKVVIKYLQEKW